MTQEDGSWLDVALWRSSEGAEDAAARIDQVPEARAWFEHIAESRGLRHVEVVDQTLFDLTGRTIDSEDSPDL